MAYASADVCDRGQIYNPAQGYVYSLPETLLETYLSGNSFDYKQGYTGEERANLERDIQDIYDQIVSRNPLKERVAVLTAGAPGAGKTWKMREDLRGRNIAYIDPDDVCLKLQTLTYLAEVDLLGLRDAYTKWRPGSNGANHLILANLIREGYAFYFGTTSTSPATKIFFQFLKEQKYEIRLIHVSAPDSVRWASLVERDKGFIQQTEEDVINKGRMLPERIIDTYLAFADRIEFCYRDEVEKEARLGAIWVRNQEANEGKLTVVDLAAYAQIKKIHNDELRRIKREDLLWESTVEKRSAFNIQ